MRILRSVSGTLTDITHQVTDYYNHSPNINLTATDYLYIGQRMPFNNIYFKVGTVNTNSVGVDKIAIWDGSAFRDCVNVVDETITSAASKVFAGSGHMSWTPNKQYLWSIDDTQTLSGSEKITGLGGVAIYDHYWVRIKLDGTLTTGTSLSWVGSLFSNDNDLSTEFPDLLKTKTLTSFLAGKTNWEEQHVRAAKLIIEDLLRMNFINHPGQILVKESLTNASVSKVAELIYQSFGPDYIELKNEVRKEYETRLEKGVFQKDLDKDGILDPEEAIQFFEAKVYRR